MTSHGGRKRRNDKAVKIARDLATKAKVIAETSDPQLTIAEYLSGLLRPLIERDWPKALRRLEQKEQGDD